MNNIRYIKIALGFGLYYNRRFYDGYNYHITFFFIVIMLGTKRRLWNGNGFD